MAWRTHASMIPAQAILGMKKETCFALVLQDICVHSVQLSFPVFQSHAATRAFNISRAAHQGGTAPLVRALLGPSSAFIAPAASNRFFFAVLASHYWSSALRRLL